MGLDRLWAGVLPLLTPLELLLVTQLSLRSEAVVEATLDELGEGAGAHPAAVGRVLRRLHGQLLDYQAGQARRPAARLRLVDLDAERLARVLDWLQSRGRVVSVPDDEPPGSRTGELVGRGSPVRKVEPGGSRTREFERGDSLFGRSGSLSSPGAKTESAFEPFAEGTLTAVERLTFRVTGRLPRESELSMFRRLLAGGLAAAQLERGVAEVLQRRRSPDPVRSMHYFEPHWKELSRASSAVWSSSAKWWRWGLPAAARQPPGRTAARNDGGE